MYLFIIFLPASTIVDIFILFFFAFTIWSPINVSKVVTYVVVAMFWVEKGCVNKRLYKKIFWEFLSRTFSRDSECVYSSIIILLKWINLKFLPLNLTSKSWKTFSNSPINNYFVSNTWRILHLIWTNRYHRLFEFLI